ncbi:hypothetical protein [Mycobacterium leprae]|uniref:hypothetical protein n=1 Tax=Mycobacterium leprae TaxID=1769 RepID=UPI000A78D7DC|nr:hypothetical protein [Mycobacterium leprae]
MSTHVALLIALPAITNGVLAPVAGIIVDRYQPRSVFGFGFSMLAIALTWLSFEMDPGTLICRLMLPPSAIDPGRRERVRLLQRFNVARVAALLVLGCNVGVYVAARVHRFVRNYCRTIHGRRHGFGDEPCSRRGTRPLPQRRRWL